MELDDVFAHFCTEAPLPVMARVALEHVLQDERLDSLFRDHAVRQYEGDLLFSAVVRLMIPVSCGIRPSVNAAFQRHGHSIGVSITSIYNKLQGIEVDVTRALVRETATVLKDVARHLRADLAIPFPDYENRILDGSHLEGSHHRIKETRKHAAAPLPGVGLVVLDPATRLVLDYVPCEDAHAQERSLLPAVIDELKSGQVWIADRNFCTSSLLWQIHTSGAFFVVRKHATNVRVRDVGPEKAAGNTATGSVFEQPVEVLDDFGNHFAARRVRVALKEKTRDGDRELVLLSNLPESVTAVSIAEGYRQRWTIESAFGEIRRCLNGEINALGYPKAALFSYGMALLSFNILSMIAAAIRAAHGPEMQETFSTQQATEDIQATAGGMMIVLKHDFWTEHYGHLSAREVADELKRLAKQVDVRRYRKAKRRPRSPPPKRKHAPGSPHVATARILQERK